MTGRVLVTGGAGFIGSHVVDRLVADEQMVTVLDDFSTGRQENLAEAMRRGEVRVVKGSVLDSGAIDHAIRGCDRVFHMAVQCVRRSLGKPIENHAVNATGTLMVLEAARRAGVSRFVYCSSSEVYGNGADEWLHEDRSICAPTTVYGAAKLAGEHYTLAYQRTYGLPAVIVRPFNAYGPREHEHGDLAEVIPRFVIRVLNGMPPVIFGTGENGRDFTEVTEVARGLVASATCDALLGRIVNIARGQMITIREVATTVAIACGRPDLAPIHIEARPGDVMALQADTRRAQELLKFRANIAFAEGLKCYVAWFRARHNDVEQLLESDPCNWQMPS